MKRLSDKLLLPAFLSRYLNNSASSDYSIIDELDQKALVSGWHEREVAHRQDIAYRGLIRQMYAGRPRQDLRVAAEAIRLTAMTDPTVLEVGCGSGYYSEILAHLLHLPLRYSGMDFSRTMVAVACQHYPSRFWVNGDATRLPFADGAYDIVFNGVSLMHIPGYSAVIAESRRVARRWCIFHTVPVLQRRKTTMLRKQAYQGETIEIIFNEAELLSLLGEAGLAVRSTLDSIPYDLQSVLGEPTVTRTYICEVR